MAADYGLLFTNQPQIQPYSSSASLLQGMQTGQDMAYKGQLTRNAKLTNSLQQMQATNNLAASVAFAPDDQKPQAYDFALRQAKAAGLDTTGLPQQWGPDAEAAVQSAYYNSGMALERMKAEAQLAMTGSLIGYRNSEIQKNNSSIQKNNFDTGGYTDATTSPTYGNVSPISSPASPYFNPTLNRSAQLPTPPSTGVAPGQLGYAQQVANQNTSAATNPSAPMLTPTVLGTSPKAQLEQQTAQGQAQGKDWVDFKSEISQGEQGYVSNKQTLDQIQSAINKQSDMENFYPPLTGGIYGTTNTGQQLNVLGKALNLEYTAQFSKTGGISRLDIPIVKSIQFLAPGTDKYKENNQIEKNRIQLATEWGHGMTQLIPSLEQNGITDKTKAIDIYNKALLKSGAIDPQTGQIDFGKLELWPKHLPENLQKSYYQDHPEMVRPNLDDKFTGVVNGKPVTASYEQVIEAANKYHTLPTNYIKSLNLQPVNPSQQSGNLPQPQLPQQQQTQQPVNIPQGQNLPRGIRNNNPGNIERTREAWNGEVQGNDPRFKTFSSPQAGINGVSTLLSKYAAQGKNTVADIIKTWAPPGENNTVAYIRDVAQKLGINPFQKLDLSNPMVKGALVKAIIEHENGRVPYSDNMILGSI